MRRSPPFSWSSRRWIITSKDGGQIEERPVTPCDLAATLYRYMGVPLDATYLDPTGRPRFLVEHAGQPLRELF